MKRNFMESDGWLIVSVLLILCFVLSPLFFAAIKSDLPYSDDDLRALAEFGEVPPSTAANGQTAVFPGRDKLERFSSLAEMKSFLERNINLTKYNYGYTDSTLLNRPQADFSFSGATGGSSMMMMSASGIDSPAMSGYSGELGGFSSTNIQVQGVDEGDIVKNDDRYAYIVSGKQIFIIDAFPPEQMRVLKVLEFNRSVNEIYVNDGMLVAVLREFQRTWVHVFDLKVMSEPELTRHVSFDGNLISSRMVGDYLYLTTSMPVGLLNDEDDLPVPIDEISYINEFDYSYSFSFIHSLNIRNPMVPPNRCTILNGKTSTVFASINNIYITNFRRLPPVSQREVEIMLIHSKLLPEGYRNQIQEVMSSEEPKWIQVRKANIIINGFLSNCTTIERMLYSKSFAGAYGETMGSIRLNYERTTIHRIALDNGDIEAIAYGEVGGRLLNRFSMDEYDGYFRIATTTGRFSFSGSDTSLNHLFVLNMSLDVVGMINDIAPGEQIYSARFVGERGYIVTFKVIDPFFVIDLSAPTNPVVAGELKIPGYSDYLHPVGVNHVLGIGKDSIDVGDFAWFQGVKVSLFDVTDMNNPIEVDNFIIGDRGTESPVLRDPHAFLFSFERGLFVMPVRLAMINHSHYSTPPPPSAYGEYVWSGAYVFSFDVEEGIELRGSIEHEMSQSQYRPHADITRTFYIDKHLFSVSSARLMVHDIDTLEIEGYIDLF